MTTPRASLKVLAVTNIYPTESSPASGTFVEQQVNGLRKIGIEVSVLFVDRRLRGIKAYLAVPRLISSALAAFDADLVHVMYGGILADLVTWRVHDRPTVVTFHGSDLLGERLSGRLRRWAAALGVWSSTRAARRAQGVIVVAKALQSELPADIDHRRVKVIPCGVDMERFRPLDRSACRRLLNWREDRFHVLFNAGGNDPVKRPTLARAAVDQVLRLGVPAEFRELRGVSNDQVPVWLNACDVLLLTSLHEGSPTIVKEALACDVPVVSVDVGDVRERIAGIDGCHVALPDTADLAAKLRLAYERGRKLDAHSKIEELSLDRIAKRLVDFYLELMPVSPQRQAS